MVHFSKTWKYVCLESLLTIWRHFIRKVCLLYKHFPIGPQSRLTKIGYPECRPCNNSSNCLSQTVLCLQCPGSQLWQEPGVLSVALVAPVLSWCPATGPVTIGPRTLPPPNPDRLHWPKPPPQPITARSSTSLHQSINSATTTRPLISGTRRCFPTIQVLTKTLLSLSACQILYHFM